MLLAEFIVRFKSTCVGAEVHDAIYLQDSGMWLVPFLNVASFILFVILC
jgi:hypothetical protein